VDFKLEFTSLSIHAKYMRAALKQAERAFAVDEVPVGAIVVYQGKIVGRGFNRSIGKLDPTAHAEIQALRQAAKRIGNYRLTSATLYCTLEPCAMCASAMVWARIRLLVYGASDSKAGAVESQMNLLKEGFWNHHIASISGVLGRESSDLLKRFFQNKRKQSKIQNALKS
jgi:tRNA(adenine34) deaminase